MTKAEKIIAFIGLGVMGYPMALNLQEKLSSDYTLLICDVNENALSKFSVEKRGSCRVETIASGYEAVQRASIVITMLPGSPAVKSVYLDPKSGIIAGAVAAAGVSPQDKIIMECGTIETSTIIEVGEAAKKANASLPAGASLKFVDAPVSGGPMGAEAGTLTFMVGCEPDVFPAVKTVLSHMGIEKNIFLCGGIGAGTAFKLINNYLSAITSLAASEALNIGVKMGLDPKLLTDVINTSGGQCWVTSASNPVPGVQANAPASRGYEGGFRIELCRKVLNMGSELAKMVGAKTILDKPTLDALDAAAADPRYTGKDARVLYKWLNEST